MDCDGLLDWEEILMGTDPRNPDTDGDGIWDGIEIGRNSSPDPLCAGIFPPPGMLFPPGSKLNITDPLLIDTDCDGLSDGEEDANKNGRLDPGETDPNNPDTDGDGLWDGLELGITQAMAMAAGTGGCPNTQYNECPDFPRRTDPLLVDTDGDGMRDGVEDANQNGCIDPGETDPTWPDIFDPVDEAACSEANLIPVDIRRNLAAQMALGLPMGFANSYVDIQRVNSGITTTGLMGVDSAKNVAFLAWKHPSPVADLSALRTLASNQASTLGGGGSAVIGSFDSWDAPLLGNDNALSVTFMLSGSMSSAGRVNEIARLLLGPARPDGTDTLQTTGSASANPQYVRAQYVLRDQGEVVVVMAVALDNNNVTGSDGFFGLNDVAGGAALARYLDRTVVQCERSLAELRAVDFLFVVDDSGTMGSSQTQLSAAGTAMAQALSNSNLDWRVALVTSSYHVRSQPDGIVDGGFNTGVVRGFTDDVYEFQSWLTPNNVCRRNDTGALCIANAPQGCSCSTTAVIAQWTGNEPACAYGVNYANGANHGCWIGTGGYGYEGMLGAARLALMDMNNASVTPRIQLRPDAEIIVIILSDAPDQTSALYASHPTPNYVEEIEYFLDFFQGKDTQARTNRVPPANSVAVQTNFCFTFPVSCTTDAQCNYGVYTAGSAVCENNACQVVNPGVCRPSCGTGPQIVCLRGSNDGNPTPVPAIRPGVTIQVNGILCPEGFGCGDDFVYGPSRLQQIVEATGGFSSSIQNLANIPNTMVEIVNSAIGRGGVVTLKPLIGASLKVAIESPLNTGGQCDGFDVPRSRIHGFDYDGIAQAVTFFGDCRPADQSHVTISYRAWEPSGRNQLPCQYDAHFDANSLDYCSGLRSCDSETDTCACPVDCGGCTTGTHCVSTARTCGCVPN